MAKAPLTQITFDFDAVLPQEPVQAPAPAKAEPAQAPVVVTENIEVPELVSVKEKITVASGKRGRRSLKEIATRVDLIQIPEDEELFKKQYYSIGEVATMFRENQSLIRYWETEFDILQPRKNRKGDRFFRPIDVKNLVLIYDLLRRRKFTIDGARDFLKKNKKAEERFAMIQSLQKIKGFFLELKANL
jgi:DNA-binding transcriptional MerR regulator